MADEADQADPNIQMELKIQLDKVLERKRIVETQDFASLQRECIDCGEEIPEARMQKEPGCERCFFCQTALERRNRHRSGSLSNSLQYEMDFAGGQDLPESFKVPRGIQVED